MKKLLTILANIPKDKLLHSFYGTLVYALSLLINPVFAISATIFIAVAKEVYDEFAYGGFDFKDILFTVLIPALLFAVELLKTVL
jgi:hypothetical protein